MDQKPRAGGNWFGAKVDHITVRAVQRVAVAIQRDRGAHLVVFRADARLLVRGVSPQRVVRTVVADAVAEPAPAVHAQQIRRRRHHTLAAIG
jgi:hypothetical protein